MARVAICPQCECELLVPDGMETAAWAKCPQCREFLDIGKASARELPSALPIDSESHPAGTPSTLVDDISNIDTWKSPKSDPAPVAEEDVVADTILFEPPAAETPDEAAQRIDAWFRSAKTVVDMGENRVESADAGPRGAESRSDESYRDDFAQESADMTDSTATVDISALGFGGGVADADFEIDAPGEKPREAAAWEDSHHMDSLLSDVESEPAAEFTLSDEATEAADDDQEHAESDDAWSAQVTASSLINAGKARRKRSLARTLVGTVVGGIFGLAIAYFALLWLRGPELDFLQLAHYLPKSILPASFGQESRQLAAAPARPAVEPAGPDATADESATTEETPKTTDEPTTPGDQPAGSVDASADKASETTVATDDAKPAAGTGEQSASFNEPVATPVATRPDDNRYGEKSAASETAPTEPAPLDTPPAATPLTTEKPVAPAADKIHVANAPTFAVDDVKAALRVADEAQPKLVAGDLADGKEVAKAKGYGYSMLADLAQKVTFVDAGAADVAFEQADELFKKTLIDVHTRGEVAQIVPRWIAAPSRKHGGIFFAGSIGGPEAKGSVTECSVDLGAGNPLTVLLPPALAEQVSAASQPVGVVGSIVDHPADQVAGYTGGATQAIFVSRIIPLQ